MHDLHVWNLSTGVNPILTAHVHVTPGSSTDVVLKRLEGHVRSIGITHSTIQVCLRRSVWEGVGACVFEAGVGRDAGACLVQRLSVIAKGRGWGLRACID